MQVLGYIARYYSDTDTYLGVKDGWVYVHGAAFGGLKNVGSVDHYLGIVDGTGGGSPVNLAGNWTGSASSLAFPGCNANLDVNMAQNSDQLTGTGTASGSRRSSGARAPTPHHTEKGNTETKQCQ